MCTASPPVRRAFPPARGLEIGVLLLVAALSAYQLLVPPIVGVADNGDYTRVMAPLGLAHVGVSYEDTVFLWVQPRFRLVPSDTSLLLPSAELLLAGTARLAHAVIVREPVFDLQLVGAVHLACYVAAIWLLLRATRLLTRAARIVVWIGVLLALPDVAYVSYLNSFYAEPASLIFVVALLGFGLAYVRADAPEPFSTWGYFICAALFVSTKAQHYVLALPLAGLPLVLAASRRWRANGKLVVPLAGALVLFGGVLFVSLPDLLRYPARWNGVFHGLLVDSPAPSQDLAALGLDPQLARWVGARALEVDGRWVAAPVTEVAGQYGFLDVGWFYLRHPGRLVKVAALCARHTFVWRQKEWPTLGNYTRASGKPPGSHAPSPTGWSDMEEKLFPRNLWFVVAFFGAYFGVAAWELRRGFDTAAGRTALLAIMVAVMAVMAFGIVVLAGGLEDVVVDLFMFRVLFDSCLVAVLAWIATSFARLLPRSSSHAG